MNPPRNHLVRAGSLNVLDFAVQTAAIFLLTPLMVSQLGPGGYGLWLLLMAGISFLLVFDFGVSSAGTRMLSSARGNDDKKACSRTLLVLSGKLRQLAAVAGLCMALAAATGFILAENGLGEPAQGWVIVVFFCPVVLSFYLKSGNMVLRSWLRFDLLVATTISRNILQTAGAVYVLIHGGSHTFIWLALAHAIPQTACHVVQSMLAARLLRQGAIPQAPEKFAGPNNTEEEELQDTSSHMFLMQLSSSFALRGETFLAGFAGGIGAVPLLAVARRFGLMLYEVAWASTGSILITGFCRDGSIQAPDLRWTTRIFSFATAHACVLLAMIIPPFVEVWLPSSLWAGGAYAVWLLPSAFLKISALPLVCFLIARKHHRFQSIFSASLAGTSLVLMGGFGWLGGLPGLLMGLIIAESLFYGIILPWKMPSLEQCGRWRLLLMDRLLPAIPGVLPVLGTSVFAGNLLVPSYLELGAFALVSTMLAGGVGWLLAWNIRSGSASSDCQNQR